MKPQVHMPTDQQPILQEESQGFQDFYSLRILKQNGFYGVTLPVTFYLGDTDAQSQLLWRVPFFIANRSYAVVQIIERHETAATNADTVQLVKVPSGTAPASGTNILSAGFLLNGAADTNQKITTISTIKIVSTAAATLSAGDALAFITSANPVAGVKGVTVSVLLRAV